MKVRRYQVVMRKKMSNLHYTHSITTKRATGSISAAQRLGHTAPKKHFSGADTVTDLTGPVIEPRTSRVDSDVFNHFGN